MKALKKESQLLRDMDVRWSSTFYMIERAIELETPLMDMLESSEFEELRKFILTDADWDLLSLCHKILKVPPSFSVYIIILKFWLFCRFHTLSSSFFQRKRPLHFVVLFLHLSIFPTHGNSSRKSNLLHASLFKPAWISLRHTIIEPMLYLLTLSQ